MKSDVKILIAGLDLTLFVPGSTWRLAHLYVLCKGGITKVHLSQTFLARVRTLLECPIILLAITGRPIYISSIAVAIIASHGWELRSVATSFSSCSKRCGSAIALSSSDTSSCPIIFTC